MKFFRHIFCVICVIVIGLNKTCWGMKCHICDDEKSCENPVLLKCNSTLVERSTEYLKILHTIFKTKPHILYYDCFHEDIQFVNGAFYTYRGCIFRHWNVCDLPVEPMETYDDDVIRKCYQCNWRYGCNGASRRFNELTQLTILAGVVAVLLTGAK